MPDSETTVAIIQARMGSTRLPGKVLKDIVGRPMLWHVVERATKASMLDEVVIATSDLPQDDDIEAFCKEQDIPVVRGSETDVLNRYYEAATEFDADTLVRITSDCPLISPDIVDRAVGTFRDSSVEYVSNKIDYAQPAGLDVEVFAFDTLELLENKVTDAEEREHVTLRILRDDTFEKQDVSSVIGYSKYDFIRGDEILRWTVDYPADLEFVRAVYERLCGDTYWIVNPVSVLELLAREPQLRTINDDAPIEEYNYD